jgi:hypothetical protein
LGGSGAAAAAAAAAVIFAQQVASKATRDTLFLSFFPVGRWPAMLAWASLVSIVVAVVAARAMTRLGPRRVMPATCALSAALLLGIAALATARSGMAAVLLFLHVAAIGPVVISGFWLVFNERFDPRTARHTIARVGGFGTLGGLAGGLMANEVAKRAGVVTMLPILAALYLLAALPLHFLARDTRMPTPAGEDAPPLGAGLRLLVTRPYLRDLGLLLLLATASAALLDYVFRQQASKAYSGAQLMAVFSTFHSAVALARVPGPGLAHPARLGSRAGEPHRGSVACGGGGELSGGAGVSRAPELGDRARDRDGDEQLGLPPRL